MPDTIILSPHIDDDIIGVGEKILQLSKDRQTVKIVYFSSSSYCFGRKDISFEKKNQKIRENEALKMANTLGISKKNLIFLRKNNYSIYDVNTFIKNFNIVAKITKKSKEIYVPAYEGGHLEHDIINFLAYCLIAKGIIKKENVYEYPQYTSKISFFDIKKLFRFLLKNKFMHNFIDNRKSNFNKINLLEDKKKLFEIYKSQDLSNFGYRDRTANMKLYDYERPPYSTYSLNMILGIFVIKFKLYEGSIRFNDFRLFVKEIKNRLDIHD